ERLRVSDACVYELATCELERVLSAPTGVDRVDRDEPRPRICVFRQLESDDASFERQVLLLGEPYLFVLSRPDQDGCYSPRSPGPRPWPRSGGRSTRRGRASRRWPPGPTPSCSGSSTRRRSPPRCGAASRATGGCAWSRPSRRGAGGWPTRATSTRARTWS